jgi:hypothetical protein
MMHGLGTLGNVKADRSTSMTMIVAYELPAGTVQGIQVGLQACEGA